jgi:hypothetical protein
MNSDLSACAVPARQGHLPTAPAGQAGAQADGNRMIEKAIGASISYILYYSMLHLYYCVFLRPFFRDLSLPETSWILNLNLYSIRLKIAHRRVRLRIGFFRFA